MKTLQVEAIYPRPYETFDDVAADHPRFVNQVYNESRLHSPFGYLIPQLEAQHVRLPVKFIA